MRAALLLALSLIAWTSYSQETNLVENGSFEADRIKPGSPDSWSAVGNPALKQGLTLDRGRDGQRCAKLECTEYNGDGSDFHAMLCQVGKVAVQRGHWYRLAFWSKGIGIKSGAVEIGLSDTREWRSSGLSEAFSPGPEWEHFQFLFRAQQDLPATASRLQFWFKSTGTLWMDEVVLSESDTGQEWFPRIATDGVKNFVPNSSFECGEANWGSTTYGLNHWEGNLYRLEGEADATVARHGTHCLRISLGPETLPVFYFDYYEPIRQPVRRVFAANRGWFRVRPGEKLTLSAFLKADADGVAAELMAHEAPDHMVSQPVTVGTSWGRHEFSFSPSQAFVFIGVGLDLERSRREAATLWVDAVQLERGEQATSYEPRTPIESFITSTVTGNVFTNCTQGASFLVHGFNDGPKQCVVEGALTVSNFFDLPVLTKQVKLKLPAHGAASFTLPNVTQGRRGAFRATWTAQNAFQTIRCSVIEPIPPGTKDSPFGFNHAYPWQFLVRLAREAGILWWRDWSAKWQTVEPEQGRFDFRIPDEQVQRVLDLDSQVEVLLPFPSAGWSSSARSEEVAKAAGNNSYLRARLPMAYAPRSLDDFGRYAARVVRHYSASQPRPVTVFQVLNEPVYTDYALPQQFGYQLEDYLQLLQTASRAMKSADSHCRVVGSISAGLDSGYTKDFIAQGGLEWADIFDLHIYDPPRPVASYEASFAAIENLMRQHGGPKPVWVTEWGCYADDDPACVPESVGDDTMNRCRWKSERAATEHIVKFATVGFAHGLRKLFFHAGTCSGINTPDAGGVLFTYGGAPRKMFAGVAAFTRVIGLPDEFLSKQEANGVTAYLFRRKDAVVAVVWSSTPSAPSARAIPRESFCWDIMGNSLARGRVLIGETPVYLTARDSKEIANFVGASSK